jgi:hypothetical protein
MSEDETKRDDEHDDSEDRAVIIERRRLLVASALASVAMGSQACDQVKRVIGIADPQPCLSPPVRPNVCLAYMPPQPEPVPQVCLSPRMVEPTNPPTPFADGDGGVVGTDLTGGAQPCLAAMDPRPQPRTCLSVSRPRVCLSARAPQPDRGSGDTVNPFKSVDDKLDDGFDDES